MSNDNENKDLAVQEPVTDLTLEDQGKLAKFKENGLPGVANIDEPQMYRMMDLYLSGKTYTQIARALRVNRTLVIYLSDRFNWYAMRREFLNELESTMRAKVQEAKVVHKDFMLQLAHAWQMKMGTKIERYLATSDESILNEIDLKEVDKYLKIVEILHKGDGPKLPTDKPAALGLNVGEGVTVERVGENKVEITPKSKTLAEKLKEFADAKRLEDEKKILEAKKK